MFMLLGISLLISHGFSTSRPSNEDEKNLENELVCDLTTAELAEALAARADFKLEKYFKLPTVKTRFDEAANHSSATGEGLVLLKPNDAMNNGDEFVRRLASRRDNDSKEIDIEVLRRETYKTNPEMYESLNMEMDVDQATGIVTVTADFQPSRNGMGTLFGGTTYAIGDAVTEGMMLEMIQRHDVAKQPFQERYAAVTASANIEFLTCTAPIVNCAAPNCVVDEEQSKSGRVKLQYFYPSFENEKGMINKVNEKGVGQMQIRGVTRKGIKDSATEGIGSVIEYNMAVLAPFGPASTAKRFDMEVVAAFDRERDAKWNLRQQQKHAEKLAEQQAKLAAEKRACEEKERLARELQEKRARIEKIVAEHEDAKRIANEQEAKRIAEIDARAREEQEALDLQQRFRNRRAANKAQANLERQEKDRLADEAQQRLDEKRNARRVTQKRNRWKRRAFEAMDNLSMQVEAEKSAVQKVLDNLRSRPRHGHSTRPEAPAYPSSYTKLGDHVQA